MLTNMLAIVYNHMQIRSFKNYPTCTTEGPERLRKNLCSSVEHVPVNLFEKFDRSERQDRELVCRTRLDRLRKPQDSRTLKSSRPGA